MMKTLTGRIPENHNSIPTNPLPPHHRLDNNDRSSIVPLLRTQTDVLAAEEAGSSVLFAFDGSRCRAREDAAGVISEWEEG